MSDAPAWVAVALSIGGYGWTEIRRAQDRRRRRRTGPSNEIRTALIAARDDCTVIIETGPQAGHFFSDPARRDVDRRLTDLAQQTTDRRLKERMDEAAVAWVKAREHIRPQRKMQFNAETGNYDYANPADAEADREHDRLQLEAAWQGQAAAVRGLERVNELSLKDP